MRNAAILSVLFVTLGALSASSCGGDKLTDDCNYLRTCGGGAGGLGAAGNGIAGRAGGTAASGGVSGAAGAGASNGGGAGKGGTSGASGASGAAGSAGEAPCNGDCAGNTPVCEAQSNTCVECLAPSDCKTPKPACNATSNKCVECTDKSTCSGPKSACDTTKNACVECTGNTDCTNTAKPLCDTTAETCVACLQQSDCTSATASACNAGTCTACTKDAECSNIAGKGVCNAGTCVQCTGAKFAACGSSMGTPLVCDSLQHTCSASKQASAGLCQSCVSDAQCTAGKICAQEQFGSSAQSVGYFCFWKQGDTADGAPSDCPTQGRPYVKTLNNAMSIDGVTSNICSLRSSTCIANNELSSKNCANPTLPDDSLCGFAPTMDSKCAAFGVGFRCTMTCISDDDCPGTTCDTGATPRVCKLQ